MTLRAKFASKVLREISFTLQSSDMIFYWSTGGLVSQEPVIYNQDGFIMVSTHL
jgi:hypothetical protein